MIETYLNKVLPNVKSILVTKDNVVQLIHNNGKEATFIIDGGKSEVADLLTSHIFKERLRRFNATGSIL